MEQGFTTAVGLIGGGKLDGKQPHLAFVVVGQPTSSNPLKAFQQGVSGEPANCAYPLWGVRCSQCGFVELYAVDR
jgi:hypothetical protein